MTAKTNEVHNGRFSWHELVVADHDKARRFYGELMGWTFKDMPMGDMTYTMAYHGETEVCGLVKPPEGMDAPAHWLGYSSVKDVDAAAQAIADKGGTILAPPMDIPIGRFSIVADPMGAVVALWNASEGDPVEVERPGLGTFCWDDLMVQDVEAACELYAEVFDLKTTQFGDAPLTERATLMHGERMRSGVTKAPEGTPAHWLSFVVVDDLEGARGRTTRLGGKVLADEIPVPNVGKFAIVADDQGAHLGLFVPAAG